MRPADHRFYIANLLFQYTHGQHKHELVVFPVVEQTLAEAKETAQKIFGVHNNGEPLHFDGIQEIGYPMTWFA